MFARTCAGTFYPPSLPRTLPTNHRPSNYPSILRFSRKYWFFVIPCYLSCQYHCSCLLPSNIPWGRCVCVVSQPPIAWWLVGNQRNHPFGKAGIHIFFSRTHDMAYCDANWFRHGRAFPTQGNTKKLWNIEHWCLCRGWFFEPNKKGGTTKGWN